MLLQTRRPRMTYCYFGHHKCASAWFCGVIPAVCQDLGLSWHTTSSFDDFDFGSPAGRANFLLFRNAGMNHVPPDRDFRGFHVIRDPRDVVTRELDLAGVHARSHVDVQAAGRCPDRVGAANGPSMLATRAQASACSTRAARRLYSTSW